MKFTVVIASLLLCVVSARETAAQSFEQLAQQETARRQAISAPARVITTADLASVRGLTIVGSGALPADTPAATVVTQRVAVVSATYQSGAVPRIPVEAVGGGEVLLEVAIDKAGRVIGVDVLRDTPPFTQEVIGVVREWRFQPAEDAEAPAPGEAVDRATLKAAESKVLVFGLFRPPALFPATLGLPPSDIASPSAAVPAPATFPAMPLYPPQSLFAGVVLAELHVGTDGGVSDARIVRSAAGLDAPALDVLRGLRFRPARVHGLAAPTMVYAIAAFRQPVTP